MLRPWKEIIADGSSSARKWLKEELRERKASGQQALLIHPVDKSPLNTKSKIDCLLFGRSPQDTVKKLAANQFYKIYRELYPAQAKEHVSLLVAEGLAMIENAKSSQAQAKQSRVWSETQAASTVNTEGMTASAQTKVARLDADSAVGARRDININDGNGAGASEPSYETEFSKALSELTPIYELSTAQQNESFPPLSPAEVAGTGLVPSSAELGNSDGMASPEVMVDFMQGSGSGNIEKDGMHGSSEGACTGAGAGAGADSSPSTKKKAARKPCGSCGKLVGNTLQCSQCKSTCYCSLDCQKAHWKGGGHKHECRPPPVEAAKAESVAAVLSKMEELSLSAGAAGNEDDDEDDCAICLDPIDSADRRQLPSCGHVYHRSCILSLRKANHSTKGLCPKCREPLPLGAKESLYQGSLRHIRAERMSKGSVQDRLLTEAEHLFREVLQEDPQHASAHYNLGAILFEHRQDIDGAKREYRAAIKCNPQLADAYCNLGSILGDHGRQDIDGAEREYRAAITCDPQHAKAHYNLGFLLEQHRQDIDGAEREYRAAIKSDPQHAYAHYNLGELLIQHRQDIDGAEREYRAAIKYGPQYVNAHFNLGVIPQLAEAHCNLGVILRNHRQDIDGAEREYRTAIKCNPQYAISHCNLGVLLKEHRQDIDGAEREYRAAIKCDPQYARAHCNLAVILEQHMQDIDGAEREYQAAIKYDPQHAYAHYNLASLLEQHRQDIDGAERELRTAITCDPHFAEAHYNLGMLLKHHRRDIDGAEREYRAAIKCNALYAEAHCNLGAILCDHRQDFHGAECEFRTAIKCDPQCTPAHRSLSIVQSKSHARSCSRAAGGEGGGGAGGAGGSDASTGSRKKGIPKKGKKKEKKR
jgi:Tfp pilus assembly protein PilF